MLRATGWGNASNHKQSLLLEKENSETKEQQQQQMNENNTKYNAK